MVFLEDILKFCYFGIFLVHFLKHIIIINFPEKPFESSKISIFCSEYLE